MITLTAPFFKGGILFAIELSQNPLKINPYLKIFHDTLSSDCAVWVEREDQRDFPDI